MAKKQDGPVITMKAALPSSPAYRVVTLSSQGNYYAGIHLTSTSLVMGASCEDASATGDAWPVQIYGTVKVMCGASVSMGAVGVQTATGKVVQADTTFVQSTTSSPVLFGLALEAGSTNTIIEVLMQPDSRILTKV